MNEKGSNHQLLKQNNHNLVKKYIYRHSPISRVEIAQRLGLTTATITGMVNPMISAGLLQGTVIATRHTDQPLDEQANVVHVFARGKQVK